MEVRLGAFATIITLAGAADGQPGVLLCHRRDSDHWMQPGGGVELGETPWEAVVREVREETGLLAEVVRLAGVYTWPEARPPELIFSFVCRVVGGQTQTSDETTATRFFALHALPPNLFAEHAERIRDALSAPDGPPWLKVPTARNANAQLAAESER